MPKSKIVIARDALMEVIAYVRKNEEEGVMDLTIDPLERAVYVLGDLLNKNK